MDTTSNLYVHIKNLSANSEYKQLYVLFSEYGKIQKLYYRPGANFANVYYETPEEIFAVIEDSRYKSWKAEPGNNCQPGSAVRRSRSRCRTKSPYPRIPCSDYRDNNHQREGTYQQTDTSESIMSDDLELEYVTQIYVDVHGNQLNVCRRRDGDFLIPLSEIRTTGFNIFKKENYNSLLVDDEQLTHEFYLHLLSEAKSFLIKNKISCVDENKITNAIEKVRTQLLNNKPIDNRRSFTGSTRSSNSFSTPVHNERNDINKQEKRYSNESFINTENYRQQNGESEMANGQVLSNDNRHQTPQKPRREGQITKNPLSNEISPFAKSRQYKSEGNNITITSTISESHSEAKKKDTEVQLNVKNHDTSTPKTKPIPKLTVDAPQHPPPIPNELRKPNINLLQKTEPVVATAAAKPVNQITLQPEFQMVKITHLESPNCCWVSPVANSDLVDTIILDVADAEESCKVVDPIVGNLVIAEYEDVWCRAKVVQITPLKVLFIDYGNIENVKSVKNIPKPIAGIPAQAVKVEFDDTCGKVLVMDMQCRIRAVKKNGDGYLVSFKEETKTSKEETKASREETKTSKEETKTNIKKEPIAFYGKPDIVSPMKDKDIVMVVGEANGQLYVRTKECFLKFKEISEQLNKTADLAELSSVKRGQVVVAIVGNNVRRAHVKDVGSVILVEFLDYPGEDSVPLKSLRAITEYLANQPRTIICAPHLDGVSKLSDKANAFIFDLIEKKTKLTVVLDGKRFDLIIPTTTESLSSKLKQLNGEITVESSASVSNEIIKYEEMQYHQLKMGIGSYMFVSVNGADDMTLIPTEGVKESMTELANITDADGKPYKPQELEMCLGLYEDSWYRCVVQEIGSDGLYDVMFVDYGNQAKLKSTELRRLSRELAAIPVIGNLCFLDDVPHDKTNIDAKIKELLPDGEIIEADVKEFDDLKYKIHVPFITKKLKELRLI